MDNTEKVVVGILGLGLAIGAIAVASRPAKAAPGTGTLSGAVGDESGDPVSGVNVTLGEMTTLTDPDGFFYFSDITTGSYPMSFIKEGYEAVYL
ncbi:MAG: carboxypeptidase-like regulatory domain-containing protein [Dehalococcoidales bacterium]|nr:carboxypeptidase-like regulatory domain-containing protein [Dehalococcoidales bacterium]